MRLRDFDGFGERLGVRENSTPASDLEIVDERVSMLDHDVEVAGNVETGIEVSEIDVATRTAGHDEILDLRNVLRAHGPVL
jgi:hypothetical protein